MSKAIRVLIVDDDVPTRVGLRTILEADHDIVVIDESADANDAYNKVSVLHPDVVLMDVQLQGSDGISATDRILRDLGHGPGAPRVIVLTTFELDEYAYRSLRAGASGFLLKRAPAEDIIDAVRTVAQGTALPFPAMARRLIHEFVAPTRSSAADVLTEREREVLTLIARGLSNREIARALAIRPDTVKSHVKHVFQKLGVRDRAQAVIAAYEGGLVTRGDP
jgi:DNA-binding NarL/FixJ family response regulator